MGKVSVILDWVFDIKLSKWQKGVVDIFEEGFQRDLVKDVEKRKGLFFWDYVLGVRKKFLESVEFLSVGEINDLVVVVKFGGNMDIKCVVVGDEGVVRVVVL